MKRFNILLFFVFLLFSTHLISQSESNDIGLSVKALFLDYISQNGGEFTDFQAYHMGFEIGFIKKIKGPIHLSIPLKVGVVQSQAGLEAFHKSIIGLDAVLQYQFTKEGAAVVPYLMGGAGYVIEMEGVNNIQIPVGIGLNFRADLRTYITWQSEFRLSLEDDRNNLHHSLGITYYLGPRKTETVKEIEPPTKELDSDGDGVMDDLDLCPQEPGIKEFDGCPDGDEDGLPDYRDLCPDTFGPIALNGCPDTDGDGISDNEDECPNMAGSPDNNGCPDNDADNDGIPDDLDKCPTVAGPATNNGCPEIDTDGDGTPDNIDKCPNEVGPKNTLGCPDQDGDGIMDSDDRCPTIPGSSLNNGCPQEDQDTDGDGVPDSIDKCPNKPGLSLYSGCPDTDGDGIDDSRDKCPNEVGDADNQGCPEGVTIPVDESNIDTDGDGIMDKDDRCPGIFGLRVHSGCPDTDGDGIDDSRDKCPNEAGNAANQGCPESIITPEIETDIDTDGDGVMDKDDRCPSIPGLPVYDGCPDTDGDGIDDSRDRCPNSAGPVDTGGCPDISPSDRRILQIAMRSVQFESNKAEIKTESFNILTQIAEIMERYPDFNLSIEGHTDNRGSAVENQKLSELRARACYNFLASSGVPRDRMTYAGLGEARPIATNETISGRTLNRRVEFGLIPRN